MSDASQLKGRTGWRRLVNAAGYSWSGLCSAWRHESAFRQEAVLSLVLLPAAWAVGTTWVERGLLMFTVFAMVVVELLNSAIEATVDRVGLDLHPLSKRAKDLGSAAVLLTLTAGAGVWAMALWNRWGAWAP